MANYYYIDCMGDYVSALKFAAGSAFQIGHRDITIIVNTLSPLHQALADWLTTTDANRLVKQKSINRNVNGVGLKLRIESEKTISYVINSNCCIALSPTKETFDRILNLHGVQDVFFVLNDQLITDYSSSLAALNAVQIGISVPPASPVNFKPSELVEIAFEDIFVSIQSKSMQILPNDPAKAHVVRGFEELRKNNLLPDADVIRHYCVANGISPGMTNEILLIRDKIDAGKRVQILPQFQILFSDGISDWKRKLEIKKSHSNESD